MILVLLESFEGLQARVLIVEANDVTDVDPILVEVVEETAGVGLGVDWPAQGMFDASGPHPSGRQLPQLLVAEREGLRTVPFGKIELLDELLGNRSAAP